MTNNWTFRHSIPYELFADGTVSYMHVTIGGTIYHTERNATDKPMTGVYEFEHDYSDVVDDEVIMEIHFICSVEVPTKWLRLSYVVVNSQKMNVYSGDYYPKHFFRDWIDTLPPPEREKNMAKVYNHGGCLGWQGRLELPLIIATNSLSYNTDTVKTGLMQSIPVILQNPEEQFPWKRK